MISCDHSVPSYVRLHSEILVPASLGRDDRRFCTRAISDVDIVLSSRTRCDGDFRSFGTERADAERCRQVPTWDRCVFADIAQPSDISLLFIPEREDSSPPQSYTCIPTHKKKQKTETAGKRERTRRQWFAGGKQILDFAPSNGELEHTSVAPKRERVFSSDGRDVRRQSGSQRTAKRSLRFSDSIVQRFAVTGQHTEHLWE